MHHHQLNLQRVSDTDCFLFFPFVILMSPTHVCMQAVSQVCVCVHVCCNKRTDMATVVMEINEMQSLMAR